jgi:hypothetical protein
LPLFEQKKDGQYRLLIVTESAVYHWEAGHNPIFAPKKRLFFVLKTGNKPDVPSAIIICCPNCYNWLMILRTI